MSSELVKNVCGVWSRPSLRLRVIVIGVVVGGLVTLMHRRFDASMPQALQLFVHALLPAVVFSAGAVAAGCRSLTWPLVRKAILTVVVVAAAFTAINNLVTLRLPLAAALNLLVPLTVSTLGASAQFSESSC